MTGANNASEEEQRTRAKILQLSPLELDVGSSVQLDAAAQLFHHVLPSISTKYLQKYMTRNGVRTLLLLLPQPTADDDEGEGYDDSDEDDDDDDSDDDDAEPQAASAADGASSTTDIAAAAAAKTAAPSDAHRAAVTALRRRLVGAVSFEVGRRLNQRLLQVGLLGVRIRFQQLGVGSRLLRPLLQQREAAQLPTGPGTLALAPAGAEPLDAAVVFADARAVPFFKRHGFSDDPLLNARYADVLEPWARSVLMTQQLPPPVPDGVGVSNASWARAEPLEQQLAAWKHARLLECDSTVQKWPPWRRHAWPQLLRLHRKSCGCLLDS